MVTDGRTGLDGCEVKASGSIKTTLLPSGGSGKAFVTTSKGNLIKSNLLHIDGTDLNNCCIMEIHPEPFTVRMGLGATTMKALTHTDHRTDQYSRYLREIIFRLYLQGHLYSNCPLQIGNPSIKVTMTDTIWFQAQEAFHFQIESLYNQFEDVTHVLFNMCLREVDTSSTLSETLGYTIIAAVVEEYHAKLFDNYAKWTDFMGIDSFPWGANEGAPWKENKKDLYLAQMMTEIILFKLIWGEASNLRHTPELLCFLFHWSMIAWEAHSSSCPIEGEFIDVTAAIIQRITDEAWHGSSKLKPPDHSSRLNYDDFNEFFWESASTRLLRSITENASKLSAEAVTTLMNTLAKSGTPGGSVKTFVEHRSYAQVLRTYMRVFHWHFFALQLLFWARSCWDESSIQACHYEFAEAILSAIILSAIQPFLELSLYDFSSLRKRSTWMFLLKANAVNIVRIAFLFAAIAILGSDQNGLGSQYFRYDGMIGFSYLLFYVIHGLWPLLHARVLGLMPFFTLIWHIPGIRWLLGPHRFTGGAALLAEDFHNIVIYVVFWMVPLIAKFIFWFFGAIPTALRSSRLLGVIESRPIYFYDVAIINDHRNLFLRFLFWSPIYILWYFDTQIFFLFWSSLYSTFLGYLRRVGYVQDIETIQKRLLPLLTSGPLFPKGVGAMAMSPEGKLQPKGEPEAYRTDRTSMAHRPRRSTSYNSSGFRTPRQGLSGSTPLSYKTGRMNRIEYTNNTDPYGKLSQNMNAVALARSHHLPIFGPIDEATRYRKCFGLIWNEIVNTWRLEDVISNEELTKLQYNELPAFLSEATVPSAPPLSMTTRSSCGSLGLRRWSEFRSHRLAPVWDRSTVRLPVYVYSDLIVSFLKECENHQLQLNENSMKKMRSREKTARHFFRKYLSSDPVDQLITNMRSCLPMEGLREVTEALFMYLSRYFSAGSIAVEAMEELWEWICFDPSRLEMFNLLILKDLRACLIKLLTIAQQSHDTMPSESALRDIETSHQSIKECFLHLVVPRVADSKDCPEEIQRYNKAVELCFSSSYTFPSWPEPPILEGTEINNLVLKLQQANLINAASSTTTVGLYHCKDAFQAYFTPTANATSGSLASNNKIRTHPSLKRETVAELRTLFKLESGAFLPRDVDGVLKMYFRRAIRILLVSEARISSSEGQRRLEFFINSLLMKMPVPPEVTQMVSLCTLTPYYREECLCDLDDLHQTTLEGTAKMDLLRSLMPQEFSNFLERVDRDREMFRVHQDFEMSVQEGTVQRQTAFKRLANCLEMKDQLFHYVQFRRQLQKWASDRSQVLYRTVRGIMYYETALQILNFVECRNYEGLHLCHDLSRLSFSQQQTLQSPDGSLWRTILQLPPPYLFTPSVKALARMKFNYIVSAQEFGSDLRCQIVGPSTVPTAEQRAALLRKNAIIEMLRKYPSLRVATIEDDIGPNGMPTGRKLTVLYKWQPRLYSAVSKPSTRSAEKESSCPMNERSRKLQTPIHGNEDEIQTAASDNEVDENGLATTTTTTTAGSTWFRTEMKQMMSPPRHVPSLSPLWRSDLDTCLHSSSDHNTTPVSILGSGIQSPARLRYLPGVHNTLQREVHSTHYPPTQGHRSPGSLEDCRTPDILTGLQGKNLDPETTATDSVCTHNNIRRLGRLQLGKLVISSSSTRYLPVSGFSRMRRTSKPSGNLEMTSESQVMEQRQLDDTPVVGRDNDLLLESVKLVQLQEDEVHGATPSKEFFAQICGYQNKRKSINTILSGELLPVFRILLPEIKDEDGQPFRRNPLIGPGKPENQNSAMIYTRGETVQAIDMNMEGYLEEAFKLRNLLQEFTAHPRMRILGFREHIFSLNVSSISSYMALQELAFVTNSQRLYHDPLCVRMHYGHPDIFDRFFIHCCGGMSKASNGINLSEDVFAGYNALARGFTIHYVDYLQVGKGRDVGLQQIFMFEKKVASGNAEQMISRDMRRMLDEADFFRTLSLYYSGPGQTSATSIGNYWDEVIAPVTIVEVQLGMLLILPIVLLTTLERGLSRALKLLLTMVAKFASLYYNFMLGTKASVVDNVLVYGGARYYETGRGFQIAHGTFQTLWCFYYFSHFQIAIEILLLLALLATYGGFTLTSYALDTWPIWVVFFSFTLTPFIFNPLGVYYSKTLDDLSDFTHWINAQDLQSGESSWRAWWRAEMDNRADVWWHNKTLVFCRLLRFIILAFGLVTVVAHKYNHSDIDTLVYLIAAFLSIGVLILFMTEFKLINPSFNKFLGFVVVLVVIGGLSWASASGILPLSVIISSLIAFAILVYGVIRITLVLTGRWGVRHPLIELSMKLFHVCFAYIIFIPIIAIASITTSFHLIQTRVLFNSKFVGIVDTGLIKKAEAEKKWE